MLIEIKKRVSSEVLFRLECGSLTIAMEAAVKAKVVLQDANLQDAYLQDAYLQDANLRGAYLQDAYLQDAYLQDANLRGAYLQDADLRGAYLQDADLQDAYIEKVKADLFSVLDAAPNEVAGLRQALVDGKVNGSAYKGECACLLGTIANVRHCEYTALGIQPDSSRPIEKFFLSIRPGITPENSGKVKEIVGWIDEWTAK